MIFVMVEHKNLHIRVIVTKLWTKMVCNKLGLCFGCVRTCLPRSRELRLVLNCHCEKRKTEFVVFGTNQQRSTRRVRDFNYVIPDNGWLVADLQAEINLEKYNALNE
jgi:hypothetical protein